MTQEYTVLHLFCGIGGTALGFQQAVSEYKGMVGRFRTLAGIDVDPEACTDFEMLTGARAVQLDLFSREDYVAFHGHEPGSNWQEATAIDLLEATGGEYPDVIFLSPPCKGFSGLLPKGKAESSKYQALNRLVIRGLALAMEAFEDNLPSVIMLENVPRITTRGKLLLKQVKKLLAAHGYEFHEGYHDCGELGGLAQHRKRYLLIARNREKMSAFIYRPPRRKVRAIGDVIGPMPLPDDPSMGPMHRLPRLQWKTWVRLALIPAGGDWRDLEKMSKNWFENAYRIIPWNEPAGTVTSGHSPSCGATSISDPRLGHIPRGGVFQVADWNEPSKAIIGHARPGGSNGVAAVADPRLNPRDNRHPGVYQVIRFDDPAPCVTGTRFGSGAPAVSDPRVPFSNCHQVQKWNEPAHAVTSATRPIAGSISVADPRVPFNNIFKVTPWNGTPGAVTSGSGQIGISIADPRLGCRARNGSYGVLAWDKPSTTVTGAGDVHAGTAAVADPRIPADGDRPDPPPIIIALDGTWHRPLTTLELAVLQGFPPFLADSRPLVLTGRSDAKWRERIGNAVPPPTAKAIATQILNALLVSSENDWVLGSTGLWVKDNEIIPTLNMGAREEGKEAEAS
ncbi:MAG: DNA cytosine methyltransferase [Bacillota bacterium]|nr:DNA cytosine methyltransferase [Bacillota bacterium]